jgi:hypothetical protein
LLCAALVAFAQCSSSEVPTAGGTPDKPVLTTSITLSPAAATVRLGDSLQLVPSVTVGGVASTGVVSFGSSHPSIASVSTTGYVRALALGVAVVTATHASGVAATATITTVNGLPATLTKMAGDGQTAVAGSVVPVSPSVRVEDIGGNPLAGIAVAFAGSGSVAQANVVTDASGRATAGSWALSNTPGANTLTATTPGLPAVSFTATGTSAPPSIQLSTDSLTLTGTESTPVVMAAVSVTATGGSGLTGLNTAPIVYAGTPNWMSATLTSASSPSTLNIAVGPQGLAIGTHTATVTITSTNAANSPKRLVITLIVTPRLAPLPTQLRLTTQPVGALPGAPLSVQPVVELRDAQGALTNASGYGVTATLSDVGGGFLGTKTVAASNGVARFTDLAVQFAGTYSLSFSTPTLTGTASSPFWVGVSSQVIVTTSPNPSVNQQLVTLTARVPSASGYSPSGGTIEFRDGASPLDNQPLVGGVASTVVGYFAPGTHNITATYSGYGVFSQAVSAPLSHVVSALSVPAVTLSASATTSVYSQLITFTATLTPGANISGNSFVLFLGNTQAIFNYNAVTGVYSGAYFMDPGTYVVVARFLGNSLWAPAASAPITVVVTKAQPVVTLTTSPNPSVSGAPVTLQAVVNGGSGTVQFRDGSTNLGSPVTVNGGVATLVTSALTGAGTTHSISADYSGNQYYTPASAVRSHVISP